MRERHASSDELYVGYRQVPPKQRRFLGWIVPVGLWAMCAASFVWARSQHAPGAGVWEQGQPVTLRGVLAAHPYPILFSTDTEGQPQAILLVEMGKHGSSTRSSAFDGRRVSVTGWPLHRDGRRMLELVPEDTAITSEPESESSRSAPAVLPSARTLGTVTLRGEIVDSKCFLGAMKPGEGKTHKECATLCIRGGIPPLFVTRDSSGKPAYYLVQDGGGGPIDPAVLPFVGDLVEIRAELVEWGGVYVLRIHPNRIHRL